MSPLRALPEATRIGEVEIAVDDIEKERMFYEKVLGLRTISRTGEVVALGSEGPPFLRLVAAPGAPPRSPRWPGLYHVAYLLPTRGDLGGFLQHAHELWPLEGASDHEVSEALYLSDAEENGIEVYSDRPRASWTLEDGGIRMGTRALDLRDLLEHAEAWRGAPPRTLIGHVHLQVSDVAKAVAFYRDAVGFDIMARLGDQAAFVSAGGYHHHIGMNAWHSRGSPPAPEGALGLRSFTILVSDASALDDAEKRIPGARREGDALVARDPSGNTLKLKAA